MRVGFALSLASMILGLILMPASVLLWLDVFEKNLDGLDRATTFGLWNDALLMGVIGFFLFLAGFSMCLVLKRDHVDNQEESTGQNSGIHDQYAAPLPSKAWYLLPIFLGMLGGVIAWMRLRKKHAQQAQRTLGLGIGVTASFVVLLVVAGTYPDVGIYTDAPDVDATARSTDEIKRNALVVPYDSLMDDNDAYSGETIRYEGQILQVQKNLFGDAYILRVATTNEGFVSSDAIWSNYEPNTDSETEWLDDLEENNKPFTGPNSNNMVSIWGTSTGLREYSGLFGNTVTIPEADVLILERKTFGGEEALGGQESDDVGAAEKQTSQSNPQLQDADDSSVGSGDEPAAPRQGIQSNPITTDVMEERSGPHRVSYEVVPDYVDEQIVKSALNDAMRVWNLANEDVNLLLVESDADLNIAWTRWMPDSTLGQYSFYNITINDETTEKHTITIRLGNDDCHSAYQQYSYDSLKHTVAHETGHYLGLRHVNYDGHLMYSGELFNVDPIDVYDNRGYNIPKVNKPEVLTIHGQSIQLQIESVNDKIDQVAVERQNIKNAYEDDPDGTWQLALEDNTEAYNTLALQLEDLEEQIRCMGD